MQDTFTEIMKKIDVIDFTPNERYIALKDVFKLIDAHIEDVKARDQIIKELNEQLKQAR